MRCSLALAFLRSDHEALVVLAHADDTTVGRQLQKAIQSYLALRGRERKFHAMKPLFGKMDSTETVAVSLAINNDQARKLSALALIDQSVNAVGGQIRNAVHLYVTRRARTKTFKRELRAMRRRDEDLLKALTKKPGG
jgi:hypothetical protein